jgi:hypothetical protein
MNVHIVMPCKNHWELTHERLWELYRKERENISSILLIDDGSTDEEVKTGIQWWKDNNMLPVESFHLQSSVGFLLASNIGLKMKCSSVPEEDIVILQSNDVKVMGKFVSQITGILTTPQRLVGGILYSHDTGWNKFGDRIFPYLEGWLLATNVNGWKALNYFDEYFAPQDYEDMDLSTTALMFGWELFPLNNVGLVHIGAQTYGYNTARETNTKINQKKFEEKWVK